jgi:carbamate kinase
LTQVSVGIDRGVDPHQCVASGPREDAGKPPGPAAMLVVAALDRSALASPDAAALEARIRAVAAALAPVARAHQLVVAHAGAPLPPGADQRLPADLLAARNAGLVGHLLTRELRNALPGAQVSSLVAQAVVSGEAGTGEPAPPSRLVEMPLLVELAGRDDRILCVGAVPVAQGSDGTFAGTGLLLDHDQAAASLAIELRADILLLLADASVVDWHWPGSAGGVVTLDARAALAPALEASRIGGKLRAACRFAQTPGTFAVIGVADAAEALVAGRAGACVALPG